jgi:hypothetical protein
MTTFTTYDLPKVWPITTLRTADVTLPHLLQNTQRFSSPFSRNTQTLQWPGALWEISANFPPITSGDTLAKLHAFITSLRGGGGTFIFPVYTCRYSPAAPLQPERVTMIPLTADITTITADTEMVTADATMVQMETVFTVTTCPDVLTINGYLMLNSGRAPLKVGSFISWDESSSGTFVDRHLHEITAMTYTPTTGATTLTVEPAMMFLPTPSTPIHVYAPGGVYQMVDDGQAVIRKAGSSASFGFSAIQKHPIRITI